jgi:16S rRNA processing protein RimM
LPSSSNPQQPDQGRNPPVRGSAGGLTPPDNLVVMARIAGAFGIKGWVKVQTFTETPDSLLAYPSWWIESTGGWRECRIEKAEVHSNSVVVKLAGSDDRDAAALFRGKQVAIPRDAFPAAGANEFYWTDLIGLSVVNMQDEDFGKVSEVFETGANDVLVVEGDRERLIPFTEQVVKQVDIAARVIRVDWGSDY